VTKTAEQLAARWNFHPTEELTDGWCSHVYADAGRVLKVPWRGEEMTSGFRASLALAGWLGPAVLEADEDTGSLLMERVLPGTRLSDAEIAEEEAREVAAGFIEALRGRIAPDGYPGLRDYFTIGLPLLDELLATSPPPAFLHADLHHFNILRSGEGWSLIDPKGLSGDPCFEAAAFLRNQIGPPTGNPALPALIRDRLDFFHARLGFDRWRMAAWGLVDQLDSGEDAHSGYVDVLRTILALD
jgi:streptomycin 6-kinase